MNATEERHEKFTLIVNLEKREWKEVQISYDQVTNLAFPNPPPGIVITYTVEYERGPKENPHGSLIKDQSVFVKNEMVFNVTETGRS